MAISRTGKRRIVVDGEEFLWRHWYGGAHVVDLHGTLNVYCIDRLALVKGPRFRAVTGCGGRHRCFACPDFFFIACGPKQVAECIRWAVKPGKDPVEVDRAQFRIPRRESR